MSIVSIVGTAVYVIACLALVCVFPLTEFARGMASMTTGQPSKGGCLLSVIGLAGLASLAGMLL